MLKIRSLAVVSLRRGVTRVICHHVPWQINLSAISAVS